MRRAVRGLHRDLGAREEDCRWDCLGDGCAPRGRSLPACAARRAHPDTVPGTPRRPDRSRPLRRKPCATPVPSRSAMTNCERRAAASISSWMCRSPAELTTSKRSAWGIGANWHHSEIGRLGSASMMVTEASSASSHATTKALVDFPRAAFGVDERDNRHARPHVFIKSGLLQMTWSTGDLPFAIIVYHLERYSMLHYDCIV